jgi:hypothetical protein
MIKKYKEQVDVLVQGGFGNQLFILLEVIRISKSINCKKIVLNICEYKYQNRDDRPLLITEFSSRGGYETSCNFVSKVKYLLAKIHVKVISQNNNYFWVSDSKKSNFEFPIIGSMHYGYFQSIRENTFDYNALEDLRSMIGMSKIPQYSKSLAVHIRRGDYMLNKHKSHGVVSIKSITKEVKRAIKHENFDSVTIFTDSPDTIEREIFLIDNLTVTIDKGGDTVEVFQRMASHKGIIASNSSFSFWAGVIGSVNYFSMPRQWMHETDSFVLGLESIRRYPCTLL